jgi:AcrR family transcriptional regulator
MLVSVSVPRGPRPGPRRASTEQQVLDAAVALLDEGGVEAASVRGIAARIGVAPNAVYTYFDDKAAIHEAIVQRLLGEVDRGVFADREMPWPQRVESLALELRARLSAHPGAVPLLVSGPLGGPRGLALNERLLELFADAGLDAAEAARRSYLLIVYVFGSVALEVADAHRPGPLEPESERVQRRREAFAQADTEQYPRTTAGAETIAAYISTEQFLWGLKRVLEGIGPGSR